MKNPSLVEGNLNPSTTIDFTADLGYGLIFQPIIGSRTSLDSLFSKSYLFAHRASRRPHEMRMRRK